MTITRGVPVNVGGVVIYPVDYIFGEKDGVIVILVAHAEANNFFAEMAEATTYF